MRVLTSFMLVIAACAPPRPSSPSAPPAPSNLPSPVATAVPVIQPSSSPSVIAAPEVKIVEPPFRSPQEWTYAPADLSVKSGTRVTWTNTGAVAHTVTADDGTSFDSGTMDPKAAFTLVPALAGTFAYHCTFHPWMKATLSVTS
jgi:plastocyanin